MSSDEEFVPFNPLDEHDYCKNNILEEHSYSKQSWVFLQPNLAFSTFKIVPGVCSWPRVKMVKFSPNSLTRNQKWSAIFLKVTLII